MILASCSDIAKKENTQEADIIGKPVLELASDLQSPEVLWAYGRLSDVQVSPDGSKLVAGGVSGWLYGFEE